jgi:transposase
MRWFGLDVHRDFCEVAVVDEKGVQIRGADRDRMPTLELFAQSLASGDVVALEATTGADQMVSVLERHAIRVVVANTRKLRSISEAKAKTDRLDAARSPGCSRSACSRRCGRRTSAHGRCGG